MIRASVAVNCQWTGRQSVRLRQQLLPGFIHANPRPLEVVRPQVNLQHILHPANEFRILLGGEDAIPRAAQASDIIGSRAILTHAKDETAKAFYSKFGFESSPVDELHLYLLMKDVKRILGQE